MRKIQTALEIAEKERKRRRIGGIVIIALLLLSTLGFALNGVGINSEETNQDGLKFDGQSWTYFLAGQPVYRFTYGLNDLNFTNLNFDKNIVDFGGKNIYIDSNEIGLREIASNLGRHTSKMGEACYGSCERDLPELSCDSADILIVIKQNYSGIREERNCVFIEEDLKIIDSFLYRILGIN